MKKFKATVLAAVLAAGMMSTLGCAEETEAATEAVTEAAEGSTESQVASKEEMAPVEDIVTDDMVPVYAESIKDGVYSIKVDSSSSMFSIEECELTVADGKMTAVMTMGGTGYLYLYMGTGEEAVAATEEDYIPFVENEEGAHTFEVPVEALDMGVDCAAFSKKKEKWYDRTLVFRADSLPQDAFAEGTITACRFRSGGRQLSDRGFSGGRFRQSYGGIPGGAYRCGRRGNSYDHLEQQFLRLYDRK